MTTVRLGEARNRLSEYIADVEHTHERVTITRHGHPAVVLISADDLASIEESLEILGTRVRWTPSGKVVQTLWRVGSRTTTKSRPGTVVAGEQALSGGHHRPRCS